MSSMYPSVYRLQIHLHDMHTVRYRPEEMITDILEDERNSKTLLTEFFMKNKEPHLTGCYLYHEFPEHFVWNAKQKKWTERIRNNRVIGRIYTVSPYQGDKFYELIILYHVRGPRSFEELRTVNGAICATFKEPLKG
ncbi:hypothetical protein LIER_03805 [Lithospermum erythrorhizon]|uniref:Uncharacterized protein n=1 Tax=Lithospermum erythrorhizon TaxID=34254 RepID=A0AAV3NX65_LITER